MSHPEYDDGNGGNQMMAIRYSLAAFLTLVLTLQAAAQQQPPTPPEAPDREQFQQFGDPSADASDGSGAALPRAYVDGAGPGWMTLTEADFADVNGDPDTWEWVGDLVRTTGEPIGVYRSKQVFTNFEMVLEWRHLQSGGNSGMFVWVPWQALAELPPGELPDYGIEVQMLDHEYAGQYFERTGKHGDFFTTNGDVFAVGESTMIPFPPTSPNGSRSFPRKELSKGAGDWNHYYVRAVNGEVRLWVNGEEVSGGNGAYPRAGHLCLEAEGAPVEFMNIRIRELP